MTRRAWIMLSRPPRCGARPTCSSRSPSTTSPRARSSASARRSARRCSSPIAAPARVLGVLRGRLRWVTVIAFVQVVGPFLLITYGENHVTLVADRASSSRARRSSPRCWPCASTTPSARTAGRWSASRSGSSASCCCSASTCRGDADELLGGGMMLLAALRLRDRVRCSSSTAGAAPRRSALAGGTMVVAALATLPLLAAAPPSADAGLDAVGSLIALGARRHRPGVPPLLHADRRGRPGARVDRRLRRARRSRSSTASCCSARR